jgi:hypothetical protein
MEDNAIIFSRRDAGMNEPADQVRDQIEAPRLPTVVPESRATT